MGLMAKVPTRIVIGIAWYYAIYSTQCLPSDALKPLIIKGSGLICSKSE